MRHPEVYTRACEQCGRALRYQKRFCSKRCYGDAKTRDLLERLNEKIVKPADPDACWAWTGLTHEWGYGLLSRAKRNERAHRLMWEAVNGPIPDGLFVLHRCDNPPCTNPRHLFLGTLADNSADMAAKGRVGKGENHWHKAFPGRKRVRLNADIVRDIRTSTEPARVLAARWNICDQTVYNIRTRRVWAHVE